MRGHVPPPGLHRVKRRGQRAWRDARGVGSPSRSGNEGRTGNKADEKTEQAHDLLHFLPRRRIDSASLCARAGAVQSQTVMGGGLLPQEGRNQRSPGSFAPHRVTTRKERVMFKGSFPALVTPFKNGELDLDTLKKLVEWHIGEGSHGLVPVGTTGESPTLTHQEHETVVEEVVRAVNGRIPVIAGAGSNNTLESIRFMQHAAKVGADAALVVTPYYNKPTQAGLIAHFTALHDCCELPIIIYNIPGRSVVDMTPETMGELAKLPRIVGVKDATGDLARVSQQRITCGKDFAQISGEDATAHGFNAQGGVGVITVTGNVAPKLVAEVQNATLAGDYAKALELQDRLMPLHQAIFTEPGLVGAKYAMSRLGLCSEEVRSPLTGLSDPTKALVDDALRFAGLMN